MPDAVWTFASMHTKNSRPTLYNIHTSFPIIYHVCLNACVKAYFCTEVINKEKQFYHYGRMRITRCKYR